MKFFTTILLALLALTASANVPDSLDAARISSSKVSSLLGKASSPVISIYRDDVVRKNISSPKSLSSLIPNLHIPEYGSAMTSSIYVRGFGSRMENPSIGLYVDDIPVLDKNIFDTDFMDVARVDFVSGPQGSLFGRNAMVGVMSITTLDPASAWRGGNRLSLSLGTGFTAEASGLWSNGRLSVSTKAFSTNGLYTNAYDDSKIDSGGGISVRLRYSPLRREGRRSDFMLWASYLSQGGWPYRQVMDDGSVAPVSYNDDCHYRRLFVLGGNAESFSLWGGTLKNVLSLQLLGDRMTLDQDFTSASMFTLQQRQRQAALSEELIFRPGKVASWWDSQSGIFAFSRYNRMHAPVHFLNDGIESLILGNANAHIPEYIGKLDFLEDNFVIGSDFDIFYQNAALFHESYFTFGKWKFTAGVRLDYEFQSMNYDSKATVNYALLPRMQSYRELESKYKGSQNLSWLQFVPKFSARYGSDTNFLYLTASEGFRAGGFNTQIFSDILQNRLTMDLMNGLGVHVDGMGEGPGASSTSYKPENSWNFEFGGRATLRGSGQLFILSGSVFDIECRNQQITVFPDGKGTGRMMTNAGKSRSYGAELSAFWSGGAYRADARLGLSHATFREYNNNVSDFSGNRIPYAPSATWAVSAGRSIGIGGAALKGIDISLMLSGCGKTWWNEENTLFQKAYGLLGADIIFNFAKFDLYLHGTNLLDRDYNVFCFKSVGNTFMQKGRPRCILAGLRLNLTEIKNKKRYNND